VRLFFNFGPLLDKKLFCSHSTAKNYKCTYCPSTYKHEKSLIEHMVKHQSGKQPNVPYRAFASINPVSAHASSMAKNDLPIMKPSAPPPYGFTPIKIEAASSLADLSVDKQSAENSENEGGGDNEMTDDSYAGAAGEIIRKDPRTGKFYCKICDRHYQYLSNYKQHMVKHSDVKKYKCTLCPMTYKTEKSYIGHMKGHEDGVIPVKPMKGGQAGWL
jgi:Zinc-finger of C2H2 type/Zinc finger, C2H2 type